MLLLLLGTDTTLEVWTGVQGETGKTAEQVNPWSVRSLHIGTFIQKIKTAKFITTLARSDLVGLHIFMKIEQLMFIITLWVLAGPIVQLQ